MCPFPPIPDEIGDLWSRMCLVFWSGHSSSQRLFLGFCQETFIGNDSYKGWQEKETDRFDELKASWHFLFLFVFLLGLQQQGIFRVPGSQVEVNDIKNSFERGRCKVTICSSWLGKPGWVLADVLELGVCRTGLDLHLFPTLHSATSL